MQLFVETIVRRIFNNIFSRNFELL